MSFDYDRPELYLGIAAFLLAAGVFGLVRRRTFIGILIAGELVFSGAALNFVAMNRFFAGDGITGQVCALFIMGLAAAEIAIALGICIAVYRHHKTVGSKDVAELRG